MPQAATDKDASYESVASGAWAQTHVVVADASGKSGAMGEYLHRACKARIPHAHHVMCWDKLLKASRQLVVAFYRFVHACLKCLEAHGCLLLILENFLMVANRFAIAIAIAIAMFVLC